ncbi:MAG: hypothetical protein ACR2LI_06015 [Propionibacteriaceae bacterium]
MLNTAADDELIRLNPCRIRGAGNEHPAERPILTLPEVMRLADSIDPRYRMLVLLAAFGSLRWGELMALLRSDFDLDLGLAHLQRSVVLVNGHQMGPMGHVSADAALVYQHRTASRDRAIADAMDDMIAGLAA